MSRFALLGKEVYDLVLERRFLLSLLLVSTVFSLVLGMMVAQPAHNPPSPLDFLGIVRFAGPLLAALLAVSLAGDAVARERQDRTLHLLFTAPATKTGYWAALLAAHTFAFGVFALLLLAFAVLGGAAMGWVTVKAMLALIFASLLPLFLTLDLLLLASSARLANGRTSLLLALVIVLLLWSTALSGPFGWALAEVPAWKVVAAWHPIDLADASAEGLLEHGTLFWTPMLKASGQAVLAAAASWASIATGEISR